MARASKYEDSRQGLIDAIEQASRGKSPTVRSLAEQCDVGVATMHSYLSKLAEEGMISWRPGKHRTLRLTEEGRRAVSSATPQLASLPSSPQVP